MTRHTGPCCPCALPEGVLLAAAAICSNSRSPGGPKLADALFAAARQAPRPESTETEGEAEND